MLVMKIGGSFQVSSVVLFIAPGSLYGGAFSDPSDENWS